MMQLRITFATTAIVALLLTGQAWAQTIATTDGPAELPPASFTGKQYVDSNGCIFVRAGYNGAVNWVPRVTRDRTAICGHKPSFAQAPAPKAVTEIVAPAPAPAAKAAPLPVEAPMAGVAVKTDPPRIRALAAPKPPAGGRLAAAKPKAPAGYKAAWSDGRLNPQRGPRTAAGDAQMAQLFEPGRVPMVPGKAAKARTRASAGTTYVLATKNAPRPAAAAPADSGKAWVQVGTFGLAANAAASAARLKAAGLPVAMSTITRDGKTLQIVLAGPFTSTTQLQSGLTAARRAGFSDAFARN